MDPRQEALSALFATVSDYQWPWLTDLCREAGFPWQCDYCGAANATAADTCGECGEEDDDISRTWLAPNFPLGKYREPRGARLWLARRLLRWAEPPLDP